MKKLFCAIATSCCIFFGFKNAIAQYPILHTGAPEKNSFSIERLQRIDHLIQQYIDSGWIKGAVAFISHDGAIVYNKSFGINDDVKKTKLQNDNIFRIASQTKAITSVAVMTLFEQGKFLLDDPISKYIPSFAHPMVVDKFNEKDTTYTTKPATREITIRDLLSHTSGIDYPQIGSAKMQAIYAKAGLQAGFVTSKRLLATEIDKLARLPLVVNPGEKFTYSMSVDVLGRLVEVVSGYSLNEYLDKVIFQPLGMIDTYFDLPTSKASRLVKVYTEDRKTHQIQPWKDNTMPGVDVNLALSRTGYYAGGAGLVSTIKDYAIFLQMMLNGGEYNGKQILSRHCVEMMTKGQIGSIPFGDDTFGLGFAITTEKGSLKLGVSPGSFAWGGFFGTDYWADPKEKIVGEIFLQQAPLTHNELHSKFKVLVYQALK